MTSKTRWGILGTGWIADLFMKDLVLTGRRVTAVGSRSQASADRFAAQFGIPHAHPSSGRGHSPLRPQDAQRTVTQSSCQTRCETGVVARWRSRGGVTGAPHTQGYTGAV